MTDRERYQRTFSTLHASAELDLEATEMKMNKRTLSKKAAALCVSAAIAVGMGTAVAAYANDVGGIQRQVQIWLHGDQTDATLEIEQTDHTQYKLTYENENGEVKEIGGGGVAYDMFGNEIPLTEEDIMQQLDCPEVVYRDDGTIVVCYHDQIIDITDRFDENDLCYVTVNSDPPTYMTIKKNQGYSSSNERYIEWED